VALPQRQNRFYTFFVRFGFILPSKPPFSKKVINNLCFAPNALPVGVLPRFFLSLINPFPTGVSQGWKEQNRYHKVR
jgi:hypothetical protein